MRMMMKVTIPILAANRAVLDGSAGRIFQRAFETLRPEATYFFPSEEGRTVLFFIDVKENSDVPAIADPFFKGLDAHVTFTPVMNPEDFRQGLAKLSH